MYSRRTLLAILAFVCVAVPLGFLLYESLVAARTNRSSQIPRSLQKLPAISFDKSRAGFIIANPYTNQVFATQEDVPALASIDAKTNSIGEVIPLRGYHTGIAIDWVKNEIYVSQEFSQTVRVIDGASNKIARDLSVPGDSPIGALAFDSNDNRLYVVRNDIQSIAILDYRDGALIGTLPIDAHYGDLKINPQTERLYVSSPLENKVTAVDTSNDTIVATIPVGKNPKAIAVNQATNRVYVTLGDENTLAVIDGNSNSFITTIPVGESPVAVDVNPITNRVYVANLASKDLTVIDGRTNQILTTVELDAQPGHLAVAPELNRVYVSSDEGHGVFVIQDAPPQGGEIVVGSDESVRALLLKEVELPANWNQIGFADGTWENVAPMTCTKFGGLIPFPNTKWVWLPGCKQNDERALLRKTFELPSADYRGVLQVRADEAAQVFLNGQRLGATRHWTTEFWYDLTPHLRQGANVLAIHAENQEGGYGALMFRAVLLP